MGTLMTNSERNIVDQCVEDLRDAKTRSELLSTTLASKKKSMEEKKKQVEKLVKARWVLTEVAKITQSRFKERVESLATLAIQSVFGGWCRFVLEFERKRNKLECRPVVMEGDNEFDIKEDMGGSIVDILALALKIVMWSLEKPRSRPVLIYDEPMPNMGELIGVAGKIFGEISHELGLQLIIVTHSEELAAVGDRVYQVVHQRPANPWSELTLLRG